MRGGSPVERFSGQHDGPAFMAGTDDMEDCGLEGVELVWMLDAAAAREGGEIGVFGHSL